MMDQLGFSVWSLERSRKRRHERNLFRGFWNNTKNKLKNSSEHDSNADVNASMRRAEDEKERTNMGAAHGSIRASYLLRIGM